jgi:hypothetical protein
VATVEITNVTSFDIDAKQLRRRNIEAPKPETQLADGTFHLVGWVIGQDSPAATVEVMHENTMIRQASVDVNRPDVVAAFPGVAGAERSGFHTVVTLSDVEEGELLVQVVLQDGSRAPLGLIQVQQHQSEERQRSVSSTRERSRPLAGFFRRMFSQGDP